LNLKNHVDDNVLLQIYTYSVKIKFQKGILRETLATAIHLK